MNESPSLSVAPPQRTPASGKGPIPNRGQMKVKIWTQLIVCLCFIVCFYVFSFIFSFRDRHVLPGHQHGGNRFFYDLSAVSPQSSIGDQGQ